jgi:ribosomal protein S18 acetylase RimI-like enzyme
VVRVARPDEHAAIGDLLLSSYGAGGHLKDDPGYAEHLADVSGRSEANPVLVAVRGDRLVGSVTITPYGTPNSHDATATELEFRFLGVAPEAWGTGVAEALVAACEDYAVEAGLDAIVITVIAWNTPALRLYRRLGFRRVPERDRLPAPGIQLCALARPVGRTPPG